MRPPREFEERADVRFLATREAGHDALVLSVHGEIDLETAPMLHEALLPILELERGAVVIDLCEVAFMDSTGAHVLLDALERLTAQKRRLGIACREHGQVHRLLAVLGLLDSVAVHRSRRSAIFGGEERIRAHAGGYRPRRSFGPTLRSLRPRR